MSKVRLHHLLTVKKHGGNYLYYSSNGVVSAATKIRYVIATKLG